MTCILFTTAIQSVTKSDYSIKLTNVTMFFSSLSFLKDSSNCDHEAVSTFTSFYCNKIFEKISFGYVDDPGLSLSTFYNRHPVSHPIRLFHPSR